MTHAFLIQQKKAIPFNYDIFSTRHNSFFIDTAKKESLNALFFYNNTSTSE